MKKAKNVVATFKIHLAGGEATPAPPVGPALGQHGIPIGDFIKRFNDATQDRKGETVPTIVTVYKNRSFSFETKSPLVSELIKRAANVEKGSGMTGRENVGTVKRSALKAIAEKKGEELCVASLEAAIRTLEGTARSCGIRVTDG